jgi:WD40-like Beta Propeller Repeat
VNQMPEETHSRGLRRHRWAVAALAVVAVAVALATARLLPLGAAGAPPARQVTAAPAPTAASSTAASPTVAEPRVFLGGVGGGRTAVISVATGKLLRYLSPPPGSQALGVLSPDRRLWFEPEEYGSCGSTWRAIVISSGRISPALGGEGGIETFALSPDGRKLALVKGEWDQAQSLCFQRLMVRDLATGATRSWPLQPDARLNQLTWSPDGTRLAYDLYGGPGGRNRHNLYVVRVATMRAVDDGLALRPPHPDCIVNLPHFRAGSGRLVVAENCDDADGNHRLGRAVLEYDPAGGAPRGTLARLPGDAMITDLSVDAPGRHVLVLLLPSASSEATAYVLRKGGPQEVFRGAFTASW